MRTFQLVQLFKGITVAENVEVGFHLVTKGAIGAALHPSALGARAGSAHPRRDAANCSPSWGSREQADTQAELLPYGQQRLLEVARAIAAKPRLLLLDEPAAGLNTDETEALAETILRIRAAASPCC